MQSDMKVYSEVGKFVVWDYVVFAAMLVISAVIGIYYAIADGGQNTSKDFLMGGRRMTAIPVALSLTASFMSAVTVLGTPAEIYRNGAMFSIFGFTYAFVVIISSEIFVPVFYRLGITSTYEGGLKAVVWTDVFQVGVMVAGFSSVIIRAAVVQGGVSTIVNDSYHGGRLNFWESLYVNLIGLWAILACAVFSGLSLYSIYKDCDPWTAHIVSAPDQLMPYLVLDILRDFPGVPGLFVSCAYSGTLSDSLIQNWYSLSYLYFSTIGTLVVVVVGVIVSLLSGSRHLDHKTPTRTKSSEMEADAQEEKADGGDAMPSTLSGIFSSVTSVEISDSESDTD
ncbi:SC5AC protein, partial [Polypterus senegalus]